MEYLAGLMAEWLFIFEDFKFWRKKKKRQKGDGKKKFSIKRVLYLSQKILIGAILIILFFYVIRGVFFLSGIAKKQTAKKLSEVSFLLEHEKETTGQYPEHLESIIRNNPLLKNVHKDYWGQTFFYERHESGDCYILISLGKDGILNTADDIKSEF